MGAFTFRARLALDRARALFGVPLRCAPRGAGDRPSPDGSLSFAVGDSPALLCYGRPSARGRAIFGGVVPWGELWRTGANEPTVLHLPFRAEVAGLRVARGKYALYTVPNPSGWTLVLNRSTRQWGLTRPERGPKGNLFPSAYTSWVAAAEVGRVPVEAREVPHVEQLTFRAEPLDDRTTLLLMEWERTQVVIPIRR